MTRYFPSFCGVCLRAVLVPNLAQSADVDATCPVCRNAVRLVPSAYYLESDRARFEQAERTLREARLSHSEFTALFLELERLLRKSDALRTALGSALQSFPALHALEATLPAGDAELRRVIGMLLAILSALSLATGSVSIRLGSPTDEAGRTSSS